MTPDRRDHPERQDDNDLLRQEVAALTTVLAALDKRLQGVLTFEEAQRQFETKQDAERSAKENTRVRKRVALTIAASVVLALVTTVFSDNYAVSHCFLGPATRAHNSVCNFFFPGFNNSIDLNQQRLSQFNGLLADIPKNSKTNHNQDVEIAHLKKEIVRLEGKNH